MKTQEALEYLRQGFRRNRLAQAYIVEGPVRGDVSDLMSQALPMFFCREEDGPCGRCTGCRQAAAHTHPDLQWVEPQKKSRIIAIGQVRDLQQRVFQTPFCGGWKVAVIVGADRLRDAAANAFLKTLEEPPAKTIFFLLTDNPQYLLPTIISRCQYLLVSGRDPELPEAWQADALGILDTGASAGGIVGAFARAGRMAALLKKLQQVAQDEVGELSDAESVEEKSQTLDARVSSRYREMRADLLRFMLTYYRDVWIAVCDAEHGELLGAASRETVMRHAARLNYRQALHNLRVIEDMNRQFEMNLTEVSVLHLGFSRLVG